MTLKLVLAFLVSLAVTLFVGKFLVPYLRSIKAGQMIKEIGPKWHMSKNGTPTMGGLMFIIGITAACLTTGFPSMLEGDFTHIFVLVFALVYGTIGFLDDYEKLKKKTNLGLTAGKKFLLQVVVAVAFVFLLRRVGHLTPNLYIPFFNVTLPIWEPAYFVFAAFVIVAVVNAVNLTDGVDGLASGTTIPVALFYTVVSFYWGYRYLALGIFASAMVGGLVGFLFFNYNPAKVFMGDTGSLFLGGAVAAMAFALDMPLILITLGIIYIIEALSDVIQVGYFKLSHGKRIFKMAPFHHHLEMGGWTGKKWKERELFWLFAGVSFVFAILSFVGVYWRYDF